MFNAANIKSWRSRLNTHLASWASCSSLLAASSCGSASCNTAVLSGRFFDRSLSSSSFRFRAARDRGSFVFRIISLTSWMCVKLEDGSVCAEAKQVGGKVRTGWQRSLITETINLAVFTWEEVFEVFHNILSLLQVILQLISGHLYFIRQLPCSLSHLVGCLLCFLEL